MPDSTGFKSTKIFCIAYACRRHVRTTAFDRFAAHGIRKTKNGKKRVSTNRCTFNEHAIGLRKRSPTVSSARTRERYRGTRSGEIVPKIRTTRATPFSSTKSPGDRPCAVVSRYLWATPTRHGHCAGACVLLSDLR